MTVYKDILNKSGRFVLTLPNGTQKYFDNAEDAQQFFDENYRDKYSMVVKSIKDRDEGDIVDGGELTEIEVSGKAPTKSSEPVQIDPIRNKIFEGEYYGRKFVPTPNNIQHFLDLYESDKHIGKEYGGKAWAKVLGTHLLAGGAAYGAAAYGPTIMPYLAKYIAAPTAAGETIDLTSRALTGTTSTETISNFLQNNFNWNPYAADFVGGLSNPGYWINFGGVGKYTKPLFNKIGLGLPSSASVELSPTIQANVNAIMPKTQTNVIGPVTKWIDKNLYRFQVATNPVLLKKKPVTIQTEDLPQFNFIKDSSQAQNSSKITNYLLFNSKKNNERVFGDAMRLTMPKINKTSFYKETLLEDNIRKQLASALVAGTSAADLTFSDSNSRPWWVRTLEYAYLGRYGLNKFAVLRAKNALQNYNNYLTNYGNYNSNILRFFNTADPLRTRPSSYQNFLNTGLTRAYFPPTTPVIKSGFNYKNAQFDDLIKLITVNNRRQSNLQGFTADTNRVYSPAGQVIAERAADGKIKLINEPELIKALSKDINIIDYTTGNRYTGKISVGDDGHINIPDEYINILRRNINYVQNILFPGSGIKVFGSSAGVTEAGFPHATHDIDFYITQNQINKLLQRGILEESDRINPGTYTYRLNPSQFGEQGNIDLNVIEQTPEGMATGVRAEELFRQYFPDDYFNVLRDFTAKKANGELPNGASLPINKTPEELLEVMDSSSKTIMDSFDIDFTAPAKSKHALRSWIHLLYSDPQQVSRGIKQYAQSMLGSRVQLFPITIDQLGNKEVNLQALKKLGTDLKDFELERIASDPQRMKNVLDAWYLMDNTAMRYIRGTWPGTTGYSSENFIKSATIWDPINNRGNGHGAGLNTTIGGDSRWTGDLKAFISPNTRYKSTNLLDLIDEINYNFGRHPDSPRILDAIPRRGENAVKLLQDVYDSRGWNFLQDGYSYTKYGPDRYASATRPFDINKDFIGFAPNRITLNALIPRLQTLKENPLSGYIFTSKRSILPKPDYYYARTSPLSPILSYNSRVKNNFYAKQYFSELLPEKYNNLAFFSIPALTSLVVGGTSYSDYRKRKWVQNMINSHDEIIQSMSEKDRKQFTQQEINKYRQYTLPIYGEEMTDDMLYYHLKSIYDQYKK